jgi:D-methionine transport system ATP-binding protein
MISVEKPTKSYGHGENTVTVLDNLHCNVRSAEIFAVVGPSGAGKTTPGAVREPVCAPHVGDVDPERREPVSARRSSVTYGASPPRHRVVPSGLSSRRTVAENIALPLDSLGVTRGDLKTCR